MDILYDCIYGRKEKNDFSECKLCDKIIVYDKNRPYKSVCWSCYGLYGEKMKPFYVGKVKPVLHPRCVLNTEKESFYTIPF